MIYSKTFDINEFTTRYAEIERLLKPLNPRQRKSLEIYLSRNLGGAFATKDFLIDCIKTFCREYADKLQYTTSAISYAEFFDIDDFAFWGDALEFVNSLNAEDKSALGWYIAFTFNETTPREEQINNLVIAESESLVDRRNVWRNCWED